MSPVPGDDNIDIGCEKLVIEDQLHECVCRVALIERDIEYHYRQGFI